jgi:GalNAc-alpha-(1->4)-GalNAc-alpha-(1->3)-diNAcBac-PP-undecaprenol alpha-1,4-N-acetyl-D-galactosaminyltransferase
MDVNCQRKCVVLVVAHLGPGGAQRVVATAANALVEKGIDVHVITLLDEPADAYGLDARVRRHRRSRLQQPAIAGPLPIAGPLQRTASRVRSALSYVLLPRDSIPAYGLGLARRARWLRKTLITIGPDAVLSFLTQTNILTVLATRGLAVRTVVSERNDPRLQRHRQRVEVLRKIVYRWSDVVTANSFGAVSALGDFVPEKKLAFLPNPLSIENSPQDITFSAPTFITVTRLVEQKGLDVLLKAAARAFRSLPDWRLAIVGDGPLRQDLETLSSNLGIASRVEWFGHVPNPTAYLRAAQFFVLTSRFEGSPNALLEAMACGLPAVVSDASPGPLELVGQEQAGLIVPVNDIEATANAITRLATDQTLRERLGEAALERTKIHQLDTAMQAWLELLDCA